jgi:hypothetical protein
MLGDFVTSRKHIDTLKGYVPTDAKRRIISGLQNYTALTGALRMYPDFVIIGARKAGTTSLYNYLVEHPSVLPALMKEIHFFTSFYSKGERWYRGNFPMRLEQWLFEKTGGRRVITGEATPNYYYDPLTPARIRAMCPNAKLILVLRDPVSRAFSDYNHDVRHGRFTASEDPFEAVVEREMSFLAGPGKEVFKSTDAFRIVNSHCRHLARGQYARHLRFWLDAFSRDQMLVIRGEELYRAPQATFGRVLEFLELQPFNLKSYQAHNSNTYRPMSPEVRERLEKYFEPYNHELYELLGEDLGWNAPREAAVAGDRESGQEVVAARRASVIPGAPA